MSNWNHGRSLPFSDLLNQFFARKPKDVDGVANTSAMYYRMKLLKLILQRFEFVGLPETWDSDYFLEHLFLDGVICITDTSAGVLALKTGVTGIGIFDQPTECIIVNPVLGQMRRTINEDCALIKIQLDYQGVGWILNRYSTMLAMCDSSIAVNLLNTKATFVFGATSKAQAETFKAIFDKISMGEPAVFTSENNTTLIKEQMFTMPAKENFIADDVQLLKRKIINEFLTDIGISNANTDKRERLVTDEVNANNDEIVANIQHWHDNINEGLNKANELFGLNLSCRIRKYEGSSINADTSGIS